SQNQYLLELESARTKPLRIYHVYSGQRAKHASAHLHVAAKTNSQTSIMETHEQINEAENFINNATSFYLENNSKVVFVKAQDLNDYSSFVQNTRALVSRDARFESITIDAGAKLSRNNIWIELEQEGASCAAHGLYALQGERQSDTNSFIHHAKGHTESSQLYKGIMNDKSHGIFTGLIRVEKDAQLVTSDQLNKNLLLTKGAHAHSRPQLEIYADDVKCAHGSTTGQLSEEEVFYFESRGIPKEKARQLLAAAFANDVLLKIKSVSLRQAAQDLLSKNFNPLKTQRSN
ncbi:MAG: Fe-S cluster assembly protein SufD, partial [Bacteriovoracaceae bacterium]